MQQRCVLAFVWPCLESSGPDLEAMRLDPFVVSAGSRQEGAHEVGPISTIAAQYFALLKTVSADREARSIAQREVAPRVPASMNTTLVRQLTW